MHHKLNNVHLVIEKNVIFHLIQDHQPGSIDLKINIHPLNIFPEKLLLKTQLICHL